ncbi:acyl-CoA N-acyltransferase [Cadophora sp. DSE1049]|nr:acyl-CoA N-acyltransferase [Cadophora sp. DSE1049]
MNPDIIIRRAELKEIPSITAIQTHYALNTVLTFATSGLTESEFEDRFHNIVSENQLPFLVAVLPTTSQIKAGTQSETEQTGDVVVGYTYISPFRPSLQAYTHTGELCLFIHPEHLYQGIGSKLLKALLEACKQSRIKEVLAVMAVDVETRGGGLGLRDWYVGWGFREVGKMERVGWKFGRWVDVNFLQLHVEGKEDEGSADETEKAVAHAV